ncbi:MAG: hypothetical protein DHS20C15_27420 [Planctomycetota bacterium]|nr:MAG: hypothetical protein DHS20C15_27420 [Planctomycetota bacterium]
MIGLDQWITVMTPERQARESWAMLHEHSGFAPPGTGRRSRSTWACRSVRRPSTRKVERPAGPERGREWRSGTQRVFGPFTLADLPDTLFMD